MASVVPAALTCTYILPSTTLPKLPSAGSSVIELVIAVAPSPTILSPDMVNIGLSVTGAIGIVMS